MKSELLAQLKGWFEGAVNSKAYQTWREEARTSWDFYDGTQWSAEEVEKLAENGQGAIVINKIAPKIDNLAGTEVAGRTRVVYRSRSGDAQEELAARVLTDLALYVAERGDQAIEISNVFRAGLVGGIGWLDIGVEDSHEGVQVFARAEDEFAVVADPLSRRPDYSDARFVARERWLDKAEVERLFPDKAASVVASLESEGGMFNSSAAPYALGRGGRGEEVGYYDAQRRLFRLVEVQYREPAKQWRLRLADGRLVATFDKGKLRLRGAHVEEVAMVPRVHVAYFAGDVMLDNRALGYGHNSFTLIPFVYKRQRGDGRPYGLVRAALDPQRELNKRRSKAMHLLNTAQVIADIDAVEDPNVLAREAARPDRIILKRAGKDLRILRNTDLAVSQVQVMEQAGRDIQDVIGVFDESLGKESNATSGIAIQQRQIAGSLNQMFAFDALRLLKKGLGEQVLELIKQYFTEEMVIAITDKLGAGRIIHLNQPVIGPDGKAVRGPDGLPVVLPDLQNGQFDVVGLIGDVAGVSYTGGVTTITCVDLLDPSQNLGLVSSAPTQVAYGPLTSGVLGNTPRRTDGVKIPAGFDTYQIVAVGDELTFTLNGSPIAAVTPDGLAGYAPMSVDSTVLGSDVTAKLVPVGAVMPFAGVSAPTGWLMCAGQDVSRSTYTALFAVLSTTYGAGNGTTTFTLPDMRGRLALGLDNMGGTDAGRLSVANTLGGNGGAQTKSGTTASYTLTVADIPAHTHDVNAVYGAASNNPTGTSMNYDSSTTGSRVVSKSIGGGRAQPQHYEL